MGYLGDSLEDYYPYQLVDEATRQIKNKANNITTEDISILHSSIDNLIQAIGNRLKYL